MLYHLCRGHHSYGIQNKDHQKIIVVVSLITPPVHGILFQALSCTAGSATERGNTSPGARLASSAEAEDVMPILSRMAFLLRSFAYLGCTNNPLFKCG
jgi:hypothetical protein